MTTEEFDPVKRSMENIVHMYRKELLKVANGDKPSVIPRSIRLRMQEYGILKKYGNKILITELGKALLIL